MALLVIYIVYTFSLKWKDIFSLVFALTVLLWSQSKTSWLALLIGISVLLLYRISNIKNRAARYASLLTILTVLILSVSAIRFSADDIKIDETFTGRSVVWEQSLQEYKKNNLGGYGPELWSENYANDQGLPWATQAHNQWYQTLGSSGNIGMIGLLVYTLTLTFMAVSCAKNTRGLSLAVVSIMLSRSFTESSFQISSLDISNVAFQVSACLIIMNSRRSSLILSGIRLKMLQNNKKAWPPESIK
ncbi:hypothetical protein GCM10008957_45280 [Deinococcus ruber]|uniref:O-antigen ligase-related domain-containing protein n=2 Tax=Deinococcus ruber TaxID=1848197 RepID=A0A918CLN7_9DEIO|nr:hypothetical protein GCM10008957_45280 [Deinococcus ruber]